MKRLRLSLKKKVLFTILLAVLPVLIFEAYLRLRTSGPLAGFMPSVPGFGELLEVDSLLQWRLRSGLKGVRLTGKSLTQPVDFIVSTNSLGLRGPEISPERNRFRILVLGDSCTFGIGVNDDETYPAGLQQRLNRASRSGHGFEVINAGVPGYTAMYGARYLAARGMALRPDLVIACFGNNCANYTTDFAGMDSRMFRHWSGSRVEDCLLHTRVYADLKRRWIVFQNRFEHPDVPHVAEGHGGKLWPRLTEEEYRGELTKMSEACAQAGKPLVLLAWPWTFQVGYPLRERDDTLYSTGLAHRLVRYQGIMREVAKARGDVFVDLCPVFQAAQGVRLYLDLTHATSEGLDLIARTLAETLERNIPAVRERLRR